ncbi:hypothetical protein P885DRAFT_80485 [Corynascus similis CBS 632.67]
MYYRAFLPSLLGVFSVAWANNAPQLVPNAVTVSPEQVTSPPEVHDVQFAAEIDKRQRNSDLMGFYQYSGHWYSETCSAGKNFAGDPDSHWAACCDAGASTCNYATACRGNDILYYRGTGRCGATQQCDTVTLLNSRGVDGTGINSAILCFPTDDFYGIPRTWYRNTFPLTTSIPMSTTTSTVTTTAAAVTVTERVTVRPNTASGHLGGAQGWGSGWRSCLVVAIMAFAGGLFA